jgi:hypothetical protein
MASSRPGSNRDRFHQDGVGKAGTDAEARVTDLANHRALLGEQANLLLFTEAHFPEPTADIRGSQELFDPADRPRLNLAERTYERLRGGIDIGR